MHCSRPVAALATILILLTLSTLAARASAAVVSVNLSDVANVSGFFHDGSPVTNGGVDTEGDAYSANLTGTTITWTGATFNLAAAGSPDALSGKTVILPAGNYSSLQLLATAVRGNQSNQTFVVNYADGTSTTAVRNLSDWFTPQNYAGESIVLKMAYRLTPSGARDSRPFNLYGYSLPLTGSKVVKSIVLPPNRKVVVLALDLILVTTNPPSNPPGGPLDVSLTAAANVHGLVTDGSPVSGGGVDGSGDAYSATLTGKSITWAGVSFSLGQAGVADAVNKTTVVLPRGNYSSVQLLGTGVHGNQVNQTFTLRYTDGTSSRILQSLSDWFTPQHFPSEAIALSMPYRLKSAGARDAGPFFIYGYSLPANPAKTLASITLPDNASVVVLAMELIPATGGAVNTECNPLSFGAVADGKTDNTTAIQDAINSCASQGGGTVELAASGSNSYVTGPITLKNHTHLQIDKGVTLQATTDHSRFVAAYLNWIYEPNEALIAGKGCTDVGITGTGIIDGAGGQLQKNGGPSWWTLASGENVTTNPSVRPYLVEFYQCDHVTVSGVTLRNAPVWTQVFRFSDTITESDTTINAPGDSPNTDGLDLVGATHVILSGLSIATGDDSIAIKSGLPIKPSDPRQVGLPRMATAHVQVSNITISGGHGLSIGSEASNGVNDVLIQGVHFSFAGNGIRIKSGRDRGNRIFGITYKDITMSHVLVPVTVNDYYPAAGGPTEPPFQKSQPITASTPFVHDITIENLTATGATQQSIVEGLPESCIHNIKLSNVNIQTSAAGLVLRHVTGTFADAIVSPGSGLPYVTQENTAVATAGTTPAIPVTPAQSGQTACAAQVIPN